MVQHMRSFIFAIDFWNGTCRKHRQVILNALSSFSWGYIISPRKTGVMLLEKQLA